MCVCVMSIFVDDPIQANLFPKLNPQCLHTAKKRLNIFLFQNGIERLHVQHVLEIYKCSLTNDLVKYSSEII